MANTKRKSSVTPDQIIQARGTWTQKTCATLAGYSMRQWQNFEAGSQLMPEAIFNEFKRRRG